MSVTAYTKEVIQQVSTDTEYCKEVFLPLIIVQDFSREELVLTGKSQQLRAGRYKKRTFLEFKVKELRQFQLPSNQCAQQQLSTKFQSFLLFQSQQDHHRFSLFACSKNYCKAVQLDQAIVAALQNCMLINETNLQSINFTKNGGYNKRDNQAREYMLIQCGWQLALQLINIWQIDSDTKGVVETHKSAYQQQPQSHQVQICGQVLMNNRGQIFDSKEFSRNCLRVLENILLFSSNDFIRSLQLETSLTRQVQMVRLLNHKPVVHQLWQQTVQFVLDQQSYTHLQEQTNQEQIAILYNCNKTDIDNIFNLYVLGQRQNIVQPHPVRALLDNATQLLDNFAFDLSLYDQEQYGLNFVLTSYYVGKNFLSSDEAMRNDRGAIAFCGTPGSGKSRLQNVLGQFMNGFNFQDHGKGITEFQNYDIVSKSFIKAEEVDMHRLNSSEWKMLADLEVPLKCRVKNQQDVELSKCTPVTITSNSDIYEIVIKQATNDLQWQAVSRRWIFIRYFGSWAHAHRRLFQEDGMIFKKDFHDTYNNKNINQTLMNTIIALGISFEHSLAYPLYIIPYYKACTLAFSMTFFGQVYMSYTILIQQLLKKLADAYCKLPDQQARQVQIESGEALDKIQFQYMERLIQKYKLGSPCIDDVIYALKNPWYLRFARLMTVPEIQYAVLQNQDFVLTQYLINNKTKSVIYQEMLTEKTVHFQEAKAEECAFEQTLFDVSECFN